MGSKNFVLTESDLAFNPSPKTSWRETSSIDIVICLDSSGSMEATDFSPSRFEAAKQAANAFAYRKIMENHNDRVALITFGGRAKIQQGLTPNLNYITDAIFKLGQKSITHNSTSIGNALEEGFKILKESKTTPKALVLVTDGDNQVGKDPLKVLLSNPDIPVYTIGIGTSEGINVNIPGIGNVIVKLNDQLLQQIAKKSGGKYFHAPKVTDLIGIFEDLTQL